MSYPHNIFIHLWRYTKEKPTAAYITLKHSTLTQLAKKCYPENQLDINCEKKSGKKATMILTWFPILTTYLWRYTKKNLTANYITLKHSTLAKLAKKCYPEKPI